DTARTFSFLALLRHVELGNQAQSLAQNISLTSETILLARQSKVVPAGDSILVTISVGVGDSLRGVFAVGSGVQAWLHNSTGKTLWERGSSMELFFSSADTLEYGVFNPGSAALPVTDTLIARKNWGD
ncbi:MAG TPA: hypothetical protein VLM37_02715, partial [Fibrobacteraceae bacterium]|nr:hypothetical protein [Fibrobacteraceae bacterium]